MTLFFNRRIKRATAWVLLLGWLVALSAGVANACLLDGEGPHGHRPAAAGKAEDHPKVTAGHRTDTHAEQAGHADQRPSKAPCLKVCDEVPQSPVKQVSNHEPDGPALAVVLSSPWSPPPSFEGFEAFQSALARTPPPGPPPRVKFSRLAL